MNNRRTPQPRCKVGRPVSLLIGNNARRVICELKDMSVTGARLASVPLRHLPERFRILISNDNLALDCTLRWFEGAEAGVQFTGDADYRFNIYDEHHV